MYFIDEKHIVWFKAGKDTSQIARFVEHWAGGNLETYAQFIGNDVAQSSLTQSRRSVKQHVVECLATKSGSLNKDTQIVYHLVLSVEIAEVQRAQGVLEVAFSFVELLLSYIKIFSHCSFFFKGKDTQTPRHFP